jgi:hypothetical protein
VRFAGSQVPAEIELVGTDGRSEPITVGGEDSGALLRCTIKLCTCRAVRLKPPLKRPEA